MTQGKLELELIMYLDTVLPYNHSLVNSGIRNEFLVKKYPQVMCHTCMLFPFRRAGGCGWAGACESRWVWVCRWVWATVAGCGHVPPSVAIKKRVDRKINGEDMGGTISSAHVEISRSTRSTSGATLCLTKNAVIYVLRVLFLSTDCFPPSFIELLVLKKVSYPTRNLCLYWINYYCKKGHKVYSSTFMFVYSAEK